jgi:hypothetical protein
LEEISTTMAKKGEEDPRLVCAVCGTTETFEGHIIRSAYAKGWRVIKGSTPGLSWGCPEHVAASWSDKVYPEEECKRVGSMWSAGTIETGLPDAG